MPRKGTETFFGAAANAVSIHLEMRCPGRGRKLLFPSPRIADRFGNEMPRKGTETDAISRIAYNLYMIWK